MSKAANKDKQIFETYQEYVELGSVFSKDLHRIINEAIEKTSKQLALRQARIREAIKRHQAILLKYGQRA